MPDLNQRGLNSSTVLRETIIPRIDIITSDGSTVEVQKVPLNNGDSVVEITIQDSTEAEALTSAATIDLTSAKHTLTTDRSAITFTISYSGDEILIEITLNATESTFTFPEGSLCISEGTSSGDNTLSLSGTSGDKYILGVTKVGSNYYVGAKN